MRTGNRVDSDLLTLMLEQSDSKEGGYLVPPGYFVSLAMHQGMPKPDDLGLVAAVQAQIGAKPWWWRWLYHRYCYNKVATLIVAYCKRDVFIWMQRLCDARSKQQGYETQLAAEWFRKETTREKLEGGTS